MKQELSNVIDSFLINHPECFDPDQIAGACLNISILVIKACIRAGIKADFVLLRGYKGPTFDKIHSMWQGGDYPNHNAVHINGDIYDFTYRQFNPQTPVPFICTYQSLSENWKSIVVTSYDDSKERMEWWFSKIGD